MAKKEQVGVINSRNKDRVLMVEVDSVTYNKAVRGAGGWSLANPSQAKKAAEQEKKSVTSAEGDTSETPTSTNEPKAAEEETPTAPDPEKAAKPRKPKAEKPEGKIAKAVKAAKSKQGGDNE